MHHRVGSVVVLWWVTGRVMGVWWVRDMVCHCLISLKPSSQDHHTLLQDGDGDCGGWLWVTTPKYFEMQQIHKAIRLVESVTSHLCWRSTATDTKNPLVRAHPLWAELIVILKEGNEIWPTVKISGWLIQGAQKALHFLGDPIKYTRFNLQAHNSAL